MPTLAELRARSGPKPLPKATRTVTLVEGQHLLDDAQRLQEEHADLSTSVRRLGEDGERTGPPPKAGEGSQVPARLAEITEELAAVVDRLGDHQAELGLHGVPGGDWQRFKDENPPREDNAADLRLTAGVCNSSALFAALGRFVATWNDEKVADGDWDSWLAESITYADRRDLVSAVVDMHEAGLARAPKLRNSSLPTENSETN